MERGASAAAGGAAREGLGGRPRAGEGCGLRPRRRRRPERRAAQLPGEAEEKMATLTSGALAPVRRKPENWGGSCVLRARDDALAGAGVRKGDYLVVRRDGLPGDGALVVVRGADGGLLLRTLERFGPRVRLQPGGGPLRPFLLPHDGAGIWGTVIAVLRKYEQDQEPRRAAPPDTEPEKPEESDEIET